MRKDWGSKPLLPRTCISGASCPFFSSVWSKHPKFSPNELELTWLYVYFTLNFFVMSYDWLLICQFRWLTTIVDRIPSQVWPVFTQHYSVTRLIQIPVGLSRCYYDVSPFASWPYSGGQGNSDFNWEQVSPTTKWLIFSNAVDLQGILQLLPRFRKLTTTVKTLTRGSVFHPISCADVWGNWNFLTGVSLDFLITSKKWSVKTRIVILMSW